MTESNSADELIEFTTHACINATPMGSGKEGSVQLLFVTPPGTPDYKTTVGPGLAASIMTTIQRAIQSMPTRQFADLDVSGASTPTGRIATYFDQEYDADVLQSLGLLVVRANLLEDKLISLFSTYSGLQFATASEFLASVSLNLNRKIRTVHKQIKDSRVPESRKEMAYKALRLAQQVSTRRNHLIHAKWSFEGSRIRATTTKKTEPVTSKLVLALAADYRSVAFRLKAAAEDVVTKNQIADYKERGIGATLPDYRWH